MPTPTNVRGTRPKSAEAYTLSDAEHVSAIAEALLSLFVAADKHQAIKRITAGYLDWFREMIDAVRTARAGQAVNLTGLLRSTTAEIQSREALLALLEDARERIATAYPNDMDIQKLFGRGVKLSYFVSGPLIDTAGQMVSACDDSDTAKRASNAGLTAAKIDGITEARDALVAADKAQNVSRTTRKEHTATKNSLLAEMKTATAYIRRVAKNVLGATSANYARFASVTIRSTPKAKSKTATASASAAGAASAAAPSAPAPAATKARKRKGTGKTAKRVKQAITAKRPAVGPKPAARKAKKATKKRTPAKKTKKTRK